MQILKKLINFGDKKDERTKKFKRKENNNNIKYNNYNTYKSPIGLTLYKDAVKRRKKLENIDKNILKGIKLNSNKTKITNLSYKAALEHDEKIIEQIINKYSILNKKTNIKSIDIIGIALSLRDMKIFRELFKEKNIYDYNNINNNINIYTISDLNKIILSVEKKETRKINEINFLEQTWLLLNSQQNEYINKDIFVGLLKIIFSPEGTLKEIESLLKKYLHAALVGANIPNNIILKNNKQNKNNKKNILISPLIHKKITSKDLWPLSKYIKYFFNLKKNLIAYKTTNNLSSDKYSNLKNKKIISNIKNNNYTIDNNYTKNINNYKILENKKKPFNFDKLYKKFLEKEKCKKITLEEMRKKKEMDELKELKQKPTISKYKPNDLNENASFHNVNKKEDIHERLYKMDKEIRAKKLELIQEKERIDKEKIEKEMKSHRLSINSRLSKIRMNKTFDKPQKSKGFDEYVKRIKKGRLERLRIKYLLEKTPFGENYEEIRRKNLTPPNITDIRRMRKNEYYKTINYVNKAINNKKEIVMPESDLSRNESDGNTEYFNLQIKLPNGKMQTLKIYENDDANKVVEEFCKIHSVDSNIKNKLVANIENCQKQFLINDNKNNENIDNEEEEEDDEEEEEDEEENEESNK